MDLLAVQGTLKSLLQHHSSKASILRHSAFFIVQLSHPCMITGKTKALTRWTFVGKVMSLLFSMLSRLVWRRQWQPTPVLLLGKSLAGRSLVGYSPWGHKELDTTERLHFYFQSNILGATILRNILDNSGSFSKSQSRSHIYLHNVKES